MSETKRRIAKTDSWGASAREKRIKPTNSPGRVFIQSRKKTKKKGGEVLRRARLSKNRGKETVGPGASGNKSWLSPEKFVVWKKTRRPTSVNKGDV